LEFEVSRFQGAEKHFLEVVKGVVDMSLEEPSEWPFVQVFAVIAVAFTDRFNDFCYG